MDYSLKTTISKLNKEQLLRVQEVLGHKDAKGAKLKQLIYKDLTDEKMIYRLACIMDDREWKMLKQNLDPDQYDFSVNAKELQMIDRMQNSCLIFRLGHDLYIPDEIEILLQNIDTPAFQKDRKYCSSFRSLVTILQAYYKNPPIPISFGLYRTLIDENRLTDEDIWNIYRKMPPGYQLPVKANSFVLNEDIPYHGRKGLLSYYIPSFGEMQELIKYNYPKSQKEYKQLYRLLASATNPGYAEAMITNIFIFITMGIDEEKFLPELMGLMTNYTLTDNEKNKLEYYIDKAIESTHSPAYNGYAPNDFI